MLPCLLNLLLFLLQLICKLLSLPLNLFIFLLLFLKFLFHIYRDFGRTPQVISDEGSYLKCALNGVVESNVIYPLRTSYFILRA
jgi:hypothetical protein